MGFTRDACWFLLLRSLLIKNNKKREAALKNETGGDEKHVFLLGLSKYVFYFIYRTSHIVLWRFTILLLGKIGRQLVSIRLRCFWCLCLFSSVAPPSYAECVRGGASITNEDECGEALGDSTFTPMYPFVNNYQFPSAPPDPRCDSGSTATLTMLWPNSWSITGLSPKKLTSIC